MTYCPNPELFGSQFLSNVEVVENKRWHPTILRGDEARVTADRS